MENSPFENYQKDRSKQQIESILEAVVKVMQQNENILNQQENIVMSLNEIRALINRQTASINDVGLICRNNAIDLENQKEAINDINTKLTLLENAVKNIKVYRNVNDF